MEEIIMDPRDGEWGIHIGSTSEEGLDHSVGSVAGSDNVEGILLEGLDSYMDDINDRLIISRMVSDSVIKGMVNAIAQDAEERIKMKELEVAKLKESLSYYHMGEVEPEPISRHGVSLHELGRGNVVQLSGLDSLLELDRLKHSLKDLLASANEQFRRLQNDINSSQGFGTIRQNGSHSESVGLNGILQYQRVERWTDADKSLDLLKVMLESVSENVENIISLCDTSLQNWKQDQNLQEEIDDMVIKHGILSLQEKLNGAVKANNLRSSDISWCDSTRELSNLRQELDVISKSLSISENVLASHVSSDFNEEWSTGKRTDVFHRKTSMWEGNVNHDSQIIVPESLDYAQLKHMKDDTLFKYLKAEMIKMKRDHEAVVHEMTEEYFSLKRRGPSMRSKKDKEFDALRKQIPEVILKLDGIIAVNEDTTKLKEGLDDLKRRLDTVLAENEHLKDLLAYRQKECNRLSFLAADAEERILRHSLKERNLLKKVQNLEDKIKDMHIEAAIHENIQKCILMGLKSQIQSTNELEISGDSARKHNLKDSDVEHMITQEVLSIFVTETVKSCREVVYTLHSESARDSEQLVSLQNSILEKEKALQFGFEEKERLMRNINSLNATVQEKEQMMLEGTAELAGKIEQLVDVNEEVNKLRSKTNDQQQLISDCSKEIEGLRSKLAQALEQNRLLKVGADELSGKLESVLLELENTEKERALLIVHGEEKQNALSAITREKEEHKKQVELLHAFVLGFTKAIGDFECKVTEDTEIKSSRLEDAGKKLSYLIKKSNMQRRTGLLYKQRLEKRCLDLQKAEAEVDLLGDEVDVLLNLLKKIYIALDHYSPILKHYPGIVEILKLMRRELTGESTKPYRMHLFRGSSNEDNKYTRKNSIES